MTCFAVCAAIRPKSCGVTSSRWTLSSGTSDQSMSRSSSLTSVCERSPFSASSASSSVSARSRASSIRRSSMSGAARSSRRGSRPRRRADRRFAWRPGLLYAARSASSRALIRVSPSIPLLLDDANRLDDLSAHLAPSSSGCLARSSRTGFPRARLCASRREACAPPRLRAGREHASDRRSGPRPCARQRARSAGGASVGALCPETRRRSHTCSGSRGGPP